MARPSGIIFLFSVFGLLACDASGGRPEVVPNLCTIPLTRVLRIPIAMLTPQTAAEAPNASSANLLISPGAADEPPEGPDGFGVLDDGSLLVTDPLRSRLASFDSQGKFRNEWKIGYPADSVTVAANGEVLVREASSGRLRAYNQKGQSEPAQGTQPSPRLEARVLAGQNRGTIGPSLAIQFDKPGETLLSLESLSTDRKGDTYVALETTAQGHATEAINLNKYVRRYSSEGELVCEIADIPLDYYVSPVDEFRVHRGIVYQLQTTGSEVRVNMWDTNQPCSRPPH